MRKKVEIKRIIKIIKIVEMIRIVEIRKMIINSKIEKTKKK